MSKGAVSDKGRRAKGDRTAVTATSVLRMAALHSEGLTQLCRITNISSQGIQARVFASVAVGAQVSIRVPDEFTADGQVVWTDGNVIGVHLIKPLPASAILRLGSGEVARRRRLPRIESECEVRLRSHSKLYHCSLVNISPAGVMVVARKEMPPSGPVEIAIPNLPKIAGQVRWVEGDRLGILFNALLPLGLLTSWLSHWAGGHDSEAPAGRSDEGSLVFEFGQKGLGG
jgi:hypothetical protein